MWPAKSMGVLKEPGVVTDRITVLEREQFGTEDGSRLPSILTENHLVGITAERIGFNTQQSCYLEIEGLLQPVASGSQLAGCHHIKMFEPMRALDKRRGRRAHPS